MKRFARCVLILIMVVLISGIAGYFYEDKTQTTMYTSTTQLYVVPGEENEATVRASNGGLKDDFIIVFKSGVVIQEAQKIAGTSEDIAKYLTVNSPANSNIVEITCVNPDQNTAKLYVDAVAKTALKTTSIIPVKSIQILSEGTSDNVPVKPDLYRNTAMIAAGCGAVCVVLEIIIVLILCAFKKSEDNSDSELEYEKYYGKYAAINMQPRFIDEKKSEVKQNNESMSSDLEAKEHKEEPKHSDMKDILEDFDEDYAEKSNNEISNNEVQQKVSEDSEIQKADAKEQHKESDSEQSYKEQAASQAMQEAAVTAQEDVSDEDVLEEDIQKDSISDEDALEEGIQEDDISDEDILEEEVLAQILEEDEMIHEESKEASNREQQEMSEMEKIDIYRVGKYSSSRVIARIEK